MIQTKEREKLGILLALIFELLDETSFPDQKKRQEALNKLIIYNAESGYNFDPNDSEFLPKLLIKILEGSSRPVELPPGNLPPSELIEIYEKEKQEKEDQIQKAIGSKEAYKNYRSYIDILKKRVLVEQPKLPEQLALAIAEKSAQKAIATFEPLAHPNVATEEDKSQILKQVETIIENELKKVEIEAKVIQKAEAIVSQEAERIKNESIKIAIQPTIIEAIKTRVLPPKKEAFTSKELPPEIIKQIESTFKQETYSPAKTILSPQASFALAKRTLYTPFVKAIQMEVNSWQVPPAQKEAFERFKKMVFDGVFKEDYEATYRFLQSYLPKNHPAFTYLENEMSASDEIQKVNGKDYPFVRVLKQYYNYTKKTEKWQSFDKNLSIHLKSSPEPLWAKRGYNLLIKRFVDKFQFIPRSYQKVFTFISRGRFNSFGVFLKEKTLKPLLIKLSKTAFGQAVQQGAKKAAGWIATKLGVKAGIWAAGAAGAAPSVGVSLLIALAVEIGSRLLGKIKNLIISMVRDPEKAFLTLGSGLLILFFVSMPLALIGIIPIIIGGVGVVTFVLAPVTLGAIGGGFTTFFTALAAPIVVPIALFFITLLAILAGLTLFIVLVVSGAFILPSKVAEVTPTIISPYESPYFELKKTTIEPSIMNNLPSGSSKKITYKFTITAKDKKLTIISINEEISLITDGNPSKPQAHSFDEDLKEKGKEINPGETWEVDYPIDINSSFNNTAILNTINVNLAVDGLAGSFPGITSTIVIIGKPPGDCPLIWPTYYGYITQGPESCVSHTGQEAIDIGFGGKVGIPVLATHKGTVITVACDSKGGGNYISIKGACNGVDFYSYYFHLQNTLVDPGEPVVPGTQIATSGNTTNCSGGTRDPHLHYEFKPFGSIMMVSPYVPKTVPRKCGSGYAECDPTRPLCNISW